MNDREGFEKKEDVEIEEEETPISHEGRMWALQWAAMMKDAQQRFKQDSAHRPPWAECVSKAMLERIPPRDVGTLNVGVSVPREQLRWICRRACVTMVAVLHEYGLMMNWTRRILIKDLEMGTTQAIDLPMNIGATTLKITGIVDDTVQPFEFTVTKEKGTVYIKGSSTPFAMALWGERNMLDKLKVTPDDSTNIISFSHKQTDKKLARKGLL
jgi:hypothetical protein